MAETVPELFARAKALSPSEREALAEMLLETLDAPSITDAWAKEVEGRWEEHLASGENAVDALAAVEAARRRS